MYPSQLHEKNIEDPGNMTGLNPVLIPIRWGDRRIFDTCERGDCLLQSRQ